MPVQFLDLPVNLLVPGVRTEIDPSRAGGFSQVVKALIIAQKLSTGSAPVNAAILVSARNVDDLFGIGSMASQMVRKFRERNSWTPLYVYPLADNGLGVAATGSLNFTGSVMPIGDPMYLYVGGRRFVIHVPNGGVPGLVTVVSNAINADIDAIVTATATSSTVTLTCRHKGTVGNQVDLRFNVQADEISPNGFVCAITQMSGGSGEPDLTEVFLNLANQKYNVIAYPYPDDASLDILEGELNTRWGPLVDLGGVGVTAKTGTTGQHATSLASRNSEHLAYLCLESFPGLAIDRISEVAGHLAFEAEQDPARSLFTLPLGGYPPDAGFRFTISERNALLLDGGATLVPGPSGEVMIERLVSTRTVNATGSADSAFRDINVTLTLDYLRGSFKARMSSRFARKKLAAKLTSTDGLAGIVTPRVAKAEAGALYSEWEALGLVQDKRFFMTNSVFEVNALEPTRLDCILAPRLVNPMYVYAALIQFER